MQTIAKPLTELTAADLMTPEPVVIPKHMSLRAAAHLLSQAHISGAPVVDELGRCVGVISATDFMRYTEEGHRVENCEARAVGCICADWQILEMEELPADEVGTLMTADPVTVGPHAPITELARSMMDAHIHRVIVVDSARRPIGVVSSTDILAAVATA